jgi:signal peptidase II
MRMRPNIPNSAGVAPPISSAAAKPVNSRNGGVPPRLTFGLNAWLGLAAVVVVLDQISKAWIRSALRTGESVRVLPVFDLVLLFNPGASFSFLADAGGWQRWLFTILALLVSVWLIVLLRKHAGERLMPLALTLILGGAIGNVIDRLRFGAVVDFLHFHWNGHYFPAFNVADSCISVGVALMLWHELFGRGGKDERVRETR